MPAPEPESHFSPYVRRILSALVDATVPHVPEVPIDPTGPVVDWIDFMLGGFPPMLRRLFPLGLLALEFLPLAFLGLPRRFSNLSRERRRRYLRGFLDSRFALRRDFVKGYTGIALMGYYGLPEVLAHLGIDHQAYLDRKRAEREKLIGRPIE